jgi:hypothetical protein
MKPTTTLRPSALPALLALALGACATAPDPCPSPPSPPRAAPSMSFASGGGSVARVTREAGPDGSETLHGETELVLNTSAKRCLVEDVILDADGRLLRADITAGPSCDGAPSFHAHLDPARGIAQVTTESGALETCRDGAAGGRVPPGAPWIYTPEALPGSAATTPVAAWVALRAAVLSPTLTLIELEKRQAWRVPRDQVMVPTELGATVVLGSDGAEVNAGFVRRIRLADYGVTLVRIPGEGEPAI